MVTDPRAGHQPLTEASYVNLSTIALCNALSSGLCGHRHPCDNKGGHSVGLMWRMLAWEVLSGAAPSPMNTHGRSCLISTATDILNSLRRKSRPLLKRL